MTDNRKTPGVYVSEVSAFAAQIVGAPTSVPIFIGYTQKAVVGGEDVTLTPVAVASLADYEQAFGGADAAACEIVPAEADRTPDIAAPPLGDVTLDVAIRHTLFNSLRLFYANGGGKAYVVSVGDYSGGVTLDALGKGLAVAREQTGPTMIVIPESVLLPADAAQDGKTIPTSADFQSLIRAMLAQAGMLHDRIAILDVYGAGAVGKIGNKANDAELGECVTDFHVAAGDANLDYGAAYFPLLNSTIVSPSEIDYCCFSPSLDRLTAILKSQAAILYPDMPAGNQRHASVMSMIDAIATTLPTSSPPATPAAIAALNQNLTNAIPLLQQMEMIVAAKLGVLPPSGAMAGVMTSNDQARGVWNAPANMVLNNVAAPSVALNDAQQGPPNVPLDGKAINVVRQFVGRGPVVWGARTLDGNSNDWRYIQVRREIIYIEQSITAALNQFAFAPNVGQTWVTVTAMVSSFLQQLWQQGGLMGDKASDAFTVQCGLGSTMNAQDIIDGYMIVSVTLQVIHPAEFIELTFKQTMQGA